MQQTDICRQRKWLQELLLKFSYLCVTMPFKVAIFILNRWRVNHFYKFCSGNLLNYCSFYLFRPCPIQLHWLDMKEGKQILEIGLLLKWGYHQTGQTVLRRHNMFCPKFRPDSKNWALFRISICWSLLLMILWQKRSKLML